MTTLAATIIALSFAMNFLPIDMRKMSMNTVAEGYVKLALEIDRYDPGYVDAYFGPDEWRSSAKPADSAVIPTQELRDRIDVLLNRLGQLKSDTLTGLERMRHEYLFAHLKAAQARVDLLSGRKMSFDEESRSLYDAVAPAQADINRDSLIGELESLLPDTGLLVNRLESFLKKFYVPKEKVEAVYAAALEEARRRTREAIALPADESLRLEFVENQPWGAYNWFKGNGHSLVQVNVDLPVGINAVLGTIVHEGYPGHHTNLTLMEKRLYRDSGWVEYSIVPLYCPMSVISEGIANCASDMIFPREEGHEFAKRVLFPIAGIDTVDAERYFRIGKIRNELGKGELELVRAYLDGQMTSEQIQEELVRLAIANPREAERKIAFYDGYRAYIICYSVGKEMVKQFIEAGGDSERWTRFIDVLSTPRIPSTMVEHF